MKLVRGFASFFTQVAATRFARSAAALAFLVPLLTAGHAWGQGDEPREPPELSTFTSRSYRIHTNLSREEALEFGRHMDLVYQEYDRFFQALRGKAREQDLYLLRTVEDYILALGEFGIDARASGGMFFYGPRGSGLATFVEGRDRGDVLSTLQHEGFHQFAHFKTRGNLPIWVNEGLAEYFGDAILVDGRVKHGIVTADRLERVRVAVETNVGVPFDALLNINSQQWRAHMTSGSPRGFLQYDQSWSVVQFLIDFDVRFAKRNKRQTPPFTKYLTLLSGGRTHATAFAEAFGSTDTAPFEDRYLDFIYELEPDPYSAALSRLRFLAAGLVYLQEQEAPMPVDLGALRTALRQRGFEVVRRGHGGEHTVSASDDEPYGYQNGGGSTFPFELQASPDEALPPTLSASALKPAAHVVWRRDAEGSLRPEVVFGRAPRATSP